MWTCKKSQRIFLFYGTGVDLSSRNNLTNTGSFAKVSVPVEFIIPWLKFAFAWSCLLLFLKVIGGTVSVLLALAKIQTVHIWPSKVKRSEGLTSQSNNHFSAKIIFNVSKCICLVSRDTLYNTAVTPSTSSNVLI